MNVCNGTDIFALPWERTWTPTSAPRQAAGTTGKAANVVWCRPMCCAVCVLLSAQPFPARPSLLSWIILLLFDLLAVWFVFYICTFEFYVFYFVCANVKLCNLFISLMQANVNDNSWYTSKIIVDSYRCTNSKVRKYAKWWFALLHLTNLCICTILGS